jgi:flagellar biosynthesis/type III secretory pathway chaperone
MDSASKHPKLIANLLQIEIELTQNLSDLLTSEYTLLQGNDPEKLEQAIAKKKKLIAHLEQTVTKHNLQLEQMGYSRDREGFENYIEELTESCQIKELWSRLKEHLAACQQQNEINSGVIALSRRQVSHAIELLYGLTGGEKTYSPSGESQAHRLLNSLGKA